MHTSMLTAVVVCVLAQGSAAHKRSRKRREETKVSTFSFSLSPIMRTMIQPSHRTFAHLNLFSFYRSGKTKTKSREKKIRAQRAILVHVMHTTNATRTAKKAKKNNTPRVCYSSSSFFDLYRCGLCLKRSHTVLDTIHTVAAVVQRPEDRRSACPTVYAHFVLLARGSHVSFELRP